jgi:hypothetical protein
MANDEFSLDEEELKKSGISISDIAKKLFAVGIGAAFLTEESIRTALSELKLPKDILNTLIQNASKTKELIANQVTKEIINIISKIDFVKEASRFVEDHKFKISAEVEVLKKKKDTEADK